MTHAPMTYIFRTYCLANEPADHVVYICNKDGERNILSYRKPEQAKALMAALDGLGFTRKRR